MSIFRGMALSMLREAVHAREADDTDFTAREQEGLADAAALCRRLPRGAALIAVTRFEAAQILFAADLALLDPDFQKRMTRAQLDAAFRLRDTLSSIAYGVVGEAGSDPRKLG